LLLLFLFFFSLSIKDTVTVVGMPVSSNLGKSTGWHKCQTDCHNILHKDRIDNMPVEKTVCCFLGKRRQARREGGGQRATGEEKKKKKKKKRLF